MKKFVSMFTTVYRLSKRTMGVLWRGSVSWCRQGYRRFRALPRRYRWGGVSALLIILLLVCYGWQKRPATAQFAQAPSSHPRVRTSSPTGLVVAGATRTVHEDSVQTNAMHQLLVTQQTLQAQLKAQQAQLQQLTDTLGQFTTQHREDMTQLQQRLQTPNPTLLAQVNAVKQSVHTLVKEHAKPQWISPEQVEKHFQLVAIQGFSDGLRAIITIAGHQTALALHESCPACHGWRLASMNFNRQRAVFENAKQQRVTLVAR